MGLYTSSPHTPYKPTGRKAAGAPHQTPRFDAWNVRLYTSRMLRDVGFVRDAGPIAYFFTWATYGSWLPGDARGWMQRRGLLCRPNEPLRLAAARAMCGPPITLSPAQRELVHQAIDTTCAHRGWTMHACNCRTQHIHVVVTAQAAPTKVVLTLLKSWTTRRLRTVSCPRSDHSRWWARGGSARLIYGEVALGRVIESVMEAQDQPRNPKPPHTPAVKADRP